MFKNPFVLILLWTTILVIQILFSVYMLKIGFGLQVVAWYPIVINFIAQIALTVMIQRIQVIFTTK